MYDGKIYGVPWFTDAGLLYYRADLLEKSGYSEPPKTWAELEEMGMKTAQDQGIDNAFVFQGDQYEGGVCNGLRVHLDQRRRHPRPRRPEQGGHRQPRGDRGPHHRAEPRAGRRRAAGRGDLHGDGDGPGLPGQQGGLRAQLALHVRAGRHRRLPGRQARADRGRSRCRLAKARPSSPARSAGGTCSSTPNGHAGRGVGVRPVDDREQEQTEVAFSEASLLPTRPALYSGPGDQGHAAGRRAGRGGAQERQVAPGLTLLLGHVPGDAGAVQRGGQAATPLPRTPSRRCRRAWSRSSRRGRSPGYIRPAGDRRGRRERGEV